MQTSYTLNYIKIYLWQGLSIILNFLSMMIVIPRLTSTPVIFGIYSICISAAVFLSYADLGFLNAANKYSSECFARGERDEEVKIAGFVGFILMLMIGVFVIGVLVIAINPGLLIKNISSGEDTVIASKLLLTLALFSPVMIFQRILQLIYGVRLKDYIYQRVFIASNMVKIASVFYFFGGNKYDIVGYYLFSQVMILIACAISAIMARRKFGYEFLNLLKAFRFSKEIYRKTRKLAFGSLYSTIAWILFYEMDTIVIARLLGPEQVAIYSIGLTVMMFFRSLFGTLFAPFSVRFNHLIGLNDRGGIQSLYRGVVIVTMPIVVFPILSLVSLMKPIVYTWVGGDYTSSILIAQLLLMSYLYSFISYPASFVIIAHEKIKLLYMTASVMPAVFWIGIIVTAHMWGLKSFAIFKFVAFTMSAVAYLVISTRITRIRSWEFILKIARPAAIPCLLLVVSLMYLKQFLPMGKGKTSLMIVVATGAAASLVAMGLYYIFCEYFRNYVKRLYGKVVVSFKRMICRQPGDRLVCEE